MDDIARYNAQRWGALVRANALFTRPRLSLDASSARKYLDPRGRLGDLTGKAVLCLASGGGQQSAAFALLGAVVTVLDLSSGQLARDREAASHYNVQVKTVQGDMRDLSQLTPGSFDLVWQPYSLNFVPDARAVFREVARVIRPGGTYYFMCANPFVCGLNQKDWNGDGYSLRRPYVDGAEITYEDEDWVYDRNGASAIPGPREYRQTLSRLVNGLCEQGFLVGGLNEITAEVPDPEPGSWGHFTAIAPPWLEFWTRYLPGGLP